MQKNPSFIRCLCFSLLLSFLNFSCFASHIVGLDLYYTFVSGNTYQITLVAYGDCGPASSTAFATLDYAAPAICIYNGDTLIDNTSLAIVPPIHGIEITPVCPTVATQCTDVTSTIPGIKKFTYTGTYTLPYTSATWRILFNGNMGTAAATGRAAAITNIISGTTTELVDTINNTSFHNSSPLLTVVPTPYFCLNNGDAYSPGAVDSSGDSLSYFLVDGQCNATTTGSGVCGLGGPVAYTGTAWPGQPITAATPLNVAAGSFSFNQHTGLISFTPNVLQRSMVVYNIEQYHDGVLVGTCQREMTFLILTCTNLPASGYYSGASAGHIIDSTDFAICADVGDFTLHINPTEPDTSNFIGVTASGLPPGLVFTVTNDSTNHPQCTLSWTTTGVSPHSYVFYLTLTDNNCPLHSSETRAFTIIIGSMTSGSRNFVSCTGHPDTLAAFPGTDYLWRPATWLSCSNCANPVATPASSTIYTVTGYNLSGGCRDSFIVNVDKVSSPPPGVGPRYCCVNDSLCPLTAVGTNLLWYSATTDTGTAIAPVPSTAFPGTTTWYVTQTIDGCLSAFDSIQVIVSPPSHLTNVSPDQVVAYGSSVQLNADGTFIYLWSPDDGSLSNPNINNPLAAPKVTTRYKVFGYNIDGCLDSAFVNVTVTNDSEMIPDAFTPNGDGLNDVFRVANLKYGKLVEMRIFNRWGDLICVTTDNTKGWDGTYNGVKQDVGVYHYLIIIEHSDGITTYYKGNLTLVR